MTEDEALTTLKKFFEAKPPFAAVARFGGHAGSMAPDVFHNWFFFLPASDRTAVIDVLVASLLHGDQLAEHVSNAWHLLVEAIEADSTIVSAKARKAIEACASQPELQSRWLEDVETEEGQTKERRHTWRFALALWNVLYVIQSPTGEQLFRILTDRAKDPNFVRSLHLAKRVRDEAEM
jgi:hypothetical protein